MKSFRFFFLSLVAVMLLSAGVFAAASDELIPNEPKQIPVAWEEFPDLTPIPGDSDGLLGATADTANTKQDAMRDLIHRLLMEALQSALSGESEILNREFAYVDHYDEENKPVFSYTTMPYLKIQFRNEDGLSSEQIQQAYRYAVYDNPEDTYCIEPNLNAEYSGIQYTVYAPLAVEHLDAAKDAQYKAALNRACRECFGTVNPKESNLTPFEKVLLANDWIASNTFYDPYVSNYDADYYADRQDPYGNAEYDVEKEQYVYREDDEVYTSYGVFVNHRAVCQGYALAYEALMDRAGIPCVYVSGIGHAWNMVQLDGKWYHIDPTWSDPVWSDIGDFPGKISREWFLLSTSEMVELDVYSHGSFTTEGGYSCDDSYEGAPEIISTIQTPMFYYNDSIFYLDFKYADENPTLYRAAAGTNLADPTEATVDNGETGISAAAMDYDNGILYLRSYSSDDVYAAVLGSSPLNTSFVFRVGQESYGIGVKDGSKNGLKMLYTVIDYGVADSMEVGVPQNHTGAADIVVYYPVTMTGIEQINGSTLRFVKENGNVGAFSVWFAFYSAEGKMLGIKCVDGADSLELADLTTPDETALVKLMVLSDAGKPLSCVLELTHTED